MTEIMIRTSHIIVVYIIIIYTILFNYNTINVMMRELENTKYS